MSCYNCKYLTKRAGVGNYFIFKCSYWGLVTQRVLPQSVIIRSIGKSCPFFEQKEGKKDTKDNPNGNNSPNSSNFDITV